MSWIGQVASYYILVCFVAAIVCFRNANANTVDPNAHFKAIAMPGADVSPDNFTETGWTWVRRLWFVEVQLVVAILVLVVFL